MGVTAIVQMRKLRQVASELGLGLWLGNWQAWASSAWTLCPVLRLIHQVTHLRAGLCQTLSQAAGTEEGGQRVGIGSAEGLSPGSAFSDRLLAA